MDDLIFDILERLSKPLFDWIAVTCPGSLRARTQVFDDGWQASREALLDPTSQPKRNPELDGIALLVVEILLTYKTVIQKYNKGLAEECHTGCSPVLEEWPVFADGPLARLSLWLMNDVNLRIGLATEHCLDFNPEIVAGVTGWETDRTRILAEARSAFLSNFRFLRAHAKDSVMPRHLRLALVDEALAVPSSDELIRVKSDILYCTDLIDAYVG